MSESPIPHGKHCEPCTLRRVINLHFCILRRRYRVSKICHRDDKQNTLKVVSPHKGQTDQIIEESLYAQIHGQRKKTPPNPYPNPELKHP
jgi:hypothetical protein